MDPIKIGLLEFGYRESEYSSVGKLADVIEYAQLADELGFSRLWLGEHHNYYHLSAWSNPQFLIPILLHSTDRIKVGIAGILINYYSVYEICMNFKLIANLYPGRVDLGFANGTPPLNVAGMLRQTELQEYPKDYYKRVSRLSGMLHGEDDFQQQEKAIIPPYNGAVPDLFALSSGYAKFDFCVEERLHYAHSLFHVKTSLDVISKDAIAEYRGRFEDKHGYRPQFVLSFMGCCAASGPAAVRRAETFRKSLYGWTFLHNSLTGTPALFEDTLHRYRERFGVDEFVFYDCSITPEGKKETLHLLSEIFQLSKVKAVVS